MQQNGCALEYVKEQTPEICLEAVKQNGCALQYVKEQTSELILAEATDKTEYDMIKRALEQTDQNKTKAAKLLGISLRQFYRKINKYNL